MSPTQLRIVLDRLLEPVTRSFTPEVAQQLLALQLHPEVQDRIDLLAEKCNEGELSGEERGEYEAYVRAIVRVSVFQARTRAPRGE